MDENTYNLATSAFPSYDNATKIQLYHFLKTVENFVHPSIALNIVFSIIGVFTTSFHLFVLSQKSILKSSVILIMMGVALCDILAMVASVFYNILYLMIEFNVKPCEPPLSLPPFHMYWINIVINDFFRRCSTWLSVAMALIRWIVMKYSTRRAFRKVTLSKFGAYIFMGALALSLPLTFIFYFRYDIVKIGDWKPLNNCSKSANFTVSLNIYNLVQSEVYTANDGLVGKVYQLINGTFSKLIPCFLLPILTTLLIAELRKAKDHQRMLNSTTRLGNFPETFSQGVASTERTTGLVVFMTVSTFVIEVPGGIVRVLQFGYTDLGYWRLATSVGQICSLFFVIHASLQGVIFFLMSSQYRRTVSKIFKRDRPRVVIAVSSHFS
ncbi:G-protein coupled receptors family 1 profile domain-containing protein [Caenorhabditis elegans]|uniref:G-protein coupled receptors family 1 profile domain-containing protein n=1 Tax=Caenorhabditis elegans TaxID=6239 RepID=Q9TXU9_CAEEL|nr:G-protein coupled receptors family 1 profile domain-containing protein [Caenorhabditis elegans]CCD72217.2 G-protein coupled receptors family 1 profile domain-containing protein [Caenorhabditis elegans]|eukprot:NP_001343673.1 Serpentine Receptor, class W [Caenorhabditis elegans]